MVLQEKISFLPPIKQIISQFNLYTKKSLSQNFIFDLNLTRKIAKASQCKGKNVLEIGSGPGSLTRSLLSEGANSILAIEKDMRAVNSLDSLIKISDGKLKVIHGDAKKFSLENKNFNHKVIVGNLPYNIATTLIIYWLNQLNESKLIKVDNITVTVQKEVAKRMTAEPGNKSYGRLSVFINLLADAKILFEIPPSAFNPKPKVDSAVVNIIPLEKPRFNVNFKSFQKITNLAFNQRRKMLRQSLKSIGGQILLEKIDIKNNLRAENLSTEDFCKISKILM